MPNANTSLLDTPTFQTYQRHFTDYVRQSSITEGNRIPLPASAGIYVRLLYQKIDGCLQTCFPLTRSILGKSRWQETVRAFIRAHHCHSALYREIPDEFIKFLMNKETDLKSPDYLTEFAHYEWVELVLETEKPLMSGFAKIKPNDRNYLQIIPALNPMLYLLHYRYPVHRIVLSDQNKQTGTQQHALIQPENTFLVGIRTPNFEIQFIEVNAVTARLIELLKDEFRTGQQALLQLAVELKYDQPSALLPHGLEILKKLHHQQIIVGATNG